MKTFIYRSEQWMPRTLDEVVHSLPTRAISKS